MKCLKDQNNTPETEELMKNEISVSLKTFVQVCNLFTYIIICKFRKSLESQLIACKFDSLHVFTSDPS